MYRQCLLRLIQSTEGRSSSAWTGCLGQSDVAFALLVFLLFFFFFFLDAVVCSSPAGASVKSSGDTDRDECDEGGVGGNSMLALMLSTSHNIPPLSPDIAAGVGMMSEAVVGMRKKS